MDMVRSITYKLAQNTFARWATFAMTLAAAVVAGEAVWLHRSDRCGPRWCDSFALHHYASISFTVYCWYIAATVLVIVVYRLELARDVISLWERKCRHKRDATVEAVQSVMAVLIWALVACIFVTVAIEMALIVLTALANQGSVIPSTSVNIA